MRLSLAFVFAAIAAAYAAPITKQEINDKSAQGLRLLKLAEDADPVWKTEEELMALVRADIGFFDVTDYYDPDAPVSIASDVSIMAYPSGPTRQSTVNPIISTLTVASLQGFLNTYTAFNNRYYTSTTGVQASTWLFDTISSIISANPGSGASVARFSHSWAQSSIIARFPGTTNGAITVIGAHLDSINGNSAATGRAPGADDDGSGTVSILEAFRGLAVAKFKPLNPVEFQWYSAEEVGLRGSAAIAANYKSKGTAVKGMMQMDMTAYVKPGSTEIIGFITDFTDNSLTNYAKSLAATYNKIPAASGGACGYGCSDHASYNRNGYAATFPFEATFNNQNPNIHTSGDTTSVAGFSWTHMLEYSKLAVAFAVELGNANV